MKPLKRQRSFSQGSLSRLLQAARESWEQQDYEQSIELMENANRMDPANAAILLDLGRSHGMRYDYTAAEACFEKAVRFATQKADALVMAGLHCRNFGRHEMAVHYLERAADQPDASPDTLVKLAELYERQRRLEQASNLVERALHLDRNCDFALLARARLDRQTGRLEDAESLLRPFLAKSDPNTFGTRVRGWYELGGILDRQGRYDEAMAAFLGAKALLRPIAPPHAATLRSVRTSMQEAAEGISADILRSWFEFGSNLQPTRRLALLGGHPRSGTTLLEQVLDSHPDIVSAEETNILNFDAYGPLRRGYPADASVLSVTESASQRDLERSRETYFRYMELFLGEPIGDRLLIDKNPSLTVFPPSSIRIFPEMKFLIAIRDPRDVCLSCFMQPLPLNPVSSAYLSLESTVTEYVALMELWRTFAQRMQNPFLEVRYEEIVTDLESVARRVLGFFDVPWDPQVLRFDEHARNRVVRSPTYADVSKPIFTTAVGRWRNYQKHLDPYLDKLTPLVRALGYE